MLNQEEPHLISPFFSNKLKTWPSNTVVPDIGVNEEIDAVRNLLNRGWFDEEKCARGIQALEGYRKEWRILRAKYAT